MDAYSPESIKVHNWPAPQLMPDGKWHRTWTIRLKSNLPETIDLGASSSSITKEILDYLGEADSRLQNLGDDLALSLQLTGPREVMASMLTRQADCSDELLFAAWRMFEAVDQMLGTIETIDGQPRDNWPPWNLRPHLAKDVSN
jgi:hypothetical protein